MSSKPNSNSVIGGLLPGRMKHGFALRILYGEPSVKNQWGGETES